MEAALIQDLLDRTPFAPFRLKLSNQENVEVLHPGLVVVMRREVFIANPARDGFKIVSLMHVVGVESVQAA